MTDALPTLSASDLERISKATRLAQDRKLFVMLEPAEALALVETAIENLSRGIIHGDHGRRHDP